MVTYLRSPKLLALITLAACAWLLRSGQAVTTAAVRHAEIPRQLGPWAGDPMEAADQAAGLVDADTVTLMEYRRDGSEPPVWLAHVGGVGKRAAFHPPELCYVGSNYQIVEREPIAVTANGHRHRLMRLVIAQDDQQYESWYWFTANNRVTPSYYQQQLWLAVDAIRRTPSAGTLVRISTFLDDPDATHQRLLAFLTSLTGQRMRAANERRTPHGV